MATVGAPGGKLACAQQIAVVSFNFVPKQNPSFKYQRLGAMALVNQRYYCERHGYRYFCELPSGDDFAMAANQACWAKIPAILQALKTHRWVLWADSDALVFNFDRGLEELCNPKYDVITQCPRAYFKRIGMNEAKGLKLQPINSGVLLLQATPWTMQWLEQAYQCRPLLPPSDDWNGIGDQEALIGVLQQNPDGLQRVGYVHGLQAHPSLHEPGNLFVHFYGNQADHLFAADQVEEVLRRWERAIAQCSEQGSALPKDLARFHWCCIQNMRADEALHRGGPERFLYQAADLDIPSEAVH